MDELFALTAEDVRELLNVVKTSVFNSKRATYWPCSTALLNTSVYKKIEHAAEIALGKPVYFVFDELFTPTGDITPDYSFQEWHKDSEDESFDGGCRNIWIPLFSSGPNIDGLEVITDHSLNEYDFVLHSKSEFLPFPIEDDLLFVRKATMDTEVVNTSNIKISRPDAKLNHMYLLNSSRFHKAVDTESFQVRFSIKYSVSPFSSCVGWAAPDIMVFAFAYNVMKKQLPDDVAPRELHYEAAKFINKRLSAGFNQPDIKSQILYRNLVEGLLRTI